MLRQRIPHHFIVLSVLFLSFFLMAVGCVAPGLQETPVTPAPAMTTVKVAYMPIISFGPLFIAKDEGYFSRQGINVEFEKFPATSAALPSLIKGDIAVSGGQLFPGLVNSVSRGAHVRIVADKGMILPGSCNSSAFLIRRDLVESGMVRTMADVKGKKVAATSDQSYGMFRALATGNLTSGDVEMVDMSGAASVAAFETGAIDAAFLMEPYITLAVRREKAVVFVPGTDFIPNYTTPLYYGPAFTDTNPGLGKRFMVAYLEGVRQYNLGKTDRNIAILKNYTGMDRELLEQCCWVTVAGNGEIPRQPVRDYMDWMQKNNKISQTPDDDQLYDMSYVTFANGILQNSTSKE
ncbi:MAG: ABC transporter substrate-binding protein [Methanoregula sp.]|jgi:NitT/TauT family transport system substrate-binding protein|nr:ABC transporter substrate-binding protein [Methanoregula sp.]